MIACTADACLLEWQQSNLLIFSGTQSGAPGVEQRAARRALYSSSQSKGRPRPAGRGCCPCGKDAALDNLHYKTAARSTCRITRMIYKQSIESLTHTRARCLEKRGWVEKWATGGGGGSSGSFAAAFFLRAPFSGRSVPRVSENVRRISTHPAGAALQLDALSPCAQEFCAALGAHISSAAAVAAAPAA
jgi:hypothetical protein